MRDPSQVLADCDRAVRGSDHIIERSRESIDGLNQSIEQSRRAINATKQRLPVRLPVNPPLLRLLGGSR